MEQWKDIEGFEGLYEVSDLGRVKSLARIVSRSDGRSQKVNERILKLDGNSEYFVVGLHYSGATKHVPVHRLVAQTFIPNPENKPQVNHIDGNKHNNAVTNLEWATAEENMQHAHRLGLVDCTKIGQSTKDRFNNDEAFRKRHKNAVRESHNNPEFKAKCSQHQKLHGYKRAVVCVESGVIYESIKIAAETISRDTSSLIQALQNNTTCAGQHWQYLQGR